MLVDACSSKFDIRRIDTYSELTKGEEMNDTPKSEALRLIELLDADRPMIRVVEEIRAWAAKHGLPLDDARVQDWQHVQFNYDAACAAPGGAA